MLTIRYSARQERWLAYHGREVKFTFRQGLLTNATLRVTPSGRLFIDGNYVRKVGKDKWLANPNNAIWAANPAYPLAHQRNLPVIYKNVYIFLGDAEGVWCKNKGDIFYKDTP